MPPVWNLLLDDAFIESRKNVEVRPGRIEKDPASPLIEPVFEHEFHGNLLFGTLFRDEGRYRLWYMSLGRPPTPGGRGTNNFCYAESEDGVEWNKPRFNAVEYGGNRKNNILNGLPEPLRLNNLSVIKSPWDTEARRYKAVLFARPDEDAMGPLRGHRCIFSSDGIHWSEPKLEPAVRANEVTNLLWEPMRRDYIDLNKLHLNEEQRNFRCIARAKSDDFENWSPYKIILEPDKNDAPGDEFYGMAAFRYESHYIGLLRVYHNTSEISVKTDQCIEVQLAASRDGWNWHRICPGSTFIPIGEHEEWDFGRINVTNGPPVEHGSDLWLYYGAQNAHHRSGDYVATIGRARIRPCGFAGLDPSSPGNFGEITTVPLDIQDAKKIQINIDASHGECQAELLDAEGRPLPGFTLQDCRKITGDHTAVDVIWGGDGRTARTQVRLRIRLKDSRLYAFRIDTE